LIGREKGRFSPPRNENEKLGSVREQSLDIPAGRRIYEQVKRGLDQRGNENKASGKQILSLRKRGG